MSLSGEGVLWDRSADASSRAGCDPVPDLSASSSTLFDDDGDVGDLGRGTSLASSEVVDIDVAGGWERGEGVLQDEPVALAVALSVVDMRDGWVGDVNDDGRGTGGGATGDDEE